MSGGTPPSASTTSCIASMGCLPASSECATGGSKVRLKTGGSGRLPQGRGEPQGTSESYRNDRDGNGAVGETWVLWSELAVLNWDEEGGEYIDEDDLVRSTPGPGRRRERRGDYLNGGWATLFKLMETLAGQFGAENVRLVVWFDQW
jgi:hypothetical protein